MKASVALREFVRDGFNADERGMAVIRGVVQRELMGWL